MHEMKDSGVEWIGDIPAHWETIKFKYIHNGSNVGESVDRKFWSDDKNDFVFYTAGLQPIRTKCDDFPDWKLTGENDLLLARNGTPYVYLPPVNSMYSDHIIRVEINKNFFRNFFRYCIEQSIKYIMVDSVSIATWSVTLWNKQIIPLPPLEEQRKIAEYLDRKCNDIDYIIETQKKIIETLEDYKKSLITETVTKGLNPDVKMKDSGIEFIGKVPEHWEIRRIRTLGTVRNGLTYSPKDVCDKDKGVLVLRSSNIQNGKLTLNDNVYVSCDIKPELMVKKGDILICSRNGSRELIGKNAIIKDLNATFGAFMMIFRSESPEYLYYVLNSHIFSYYLGTFSTSTINQLTGFNFGNMKVAFCPNVHEQKEIAEYLDGKCTEIDKIISGKKQQIKTMEEYKKSLIYEAVTGKRKIYTIK